MSNPIPPIDDDTLADLADRIRPVVFGDDEDLYYIKRVDPRFAAFTWSPVITKRAKRLRPLTSITTLHTYGAPALFKPSIAEVLAQIPADLLPTVRAFHTETEGIDFTADGSYHITTTTLYSKNPKTATNK